MIEMEALVQQLAVVQAEIAGTTANMGRATKGADQRIEEAERALEVLKEHRAGVAAPFIIGIADGERLVDEIETQILKACDGEKKTMQYPAGILKFRTTQSLKIRDETLVLTGLLDHTSVKDVAMNYIKGFNLTAVKKYMGVLDLPMGAAEIEQKTTVKLVHEDTALAAELDANKDAHVHDFEAVCEETGV